MKVQKSFKVALTRACVATLLFIVLFHIQAQAQTILATIPLPSNASSYVAINDALNKIYVSGGASSNQVVFVINGSTFKGGVAGDGSGASVDNKTGNYWAAAVYGQVGIVRAGIDNLEVARVPASHGCPVVTVVDNKARRVWLANQCGGGSDPVYAFNADNFAMIAGPIRTGGVLGVAVVNPATGVLYIGPSGASKKINPKTFEVTDNAFGVVQAVDPVTGKLYAIADGTLQIIDGTQDPELITARVALDYSPSGVAVNHTLHHLYLSNSAKSCIELRDLSTGALVTTFQLAAGANPANIGVDLTRNRLYVLAAESGKNLLYVIKDDATHPQIRKK